MNDLIRAAIAYYFTSHCAYEYIERAHDVLVFIELGEESFTCVMDSTGTLRSLV